MRFHFVEDILFDHKWVEDDFIGLDHVDKTTKRTAEKAVFIRSSLTLALTLLNPLTNEITG